MKTQKDIDKLNVCSRKIVKNIFKLHGLSGYRKIGLQKTLAQAMVQAVMTGMIDVEK